MWGAFKNIWGLVYVFDWLCRYATVWQVWMPDTFFRNEKDGKFHDIIQPNLYVRVFPDGDILYSIRVSLTLACPMNLKLFPLDTQTCHLTIASYGWTERDLQYIWKVGSILYILIIFCFRESSLTYFNQC